MSLAPISASLIAFANPRLRIAPRTKMGPVGSVCVTFPIAATVAQCLSPENLTATGGGRQNDCAPPFWNLATPPARGSDEWRRRQQTAAVPVAQMIPERQLGEAHWSSVPVLSGQPFRPSRWLPACKTWPCSLQGHAKCAQPAEPGRTINASTHHQLPYKHMLQVTLARARGRQHAAQSRMQRCCKRRIPRFRVLPSDLMINDSR